MKLVSGRDVHDDGAYGRAIASYTDDELRNYACEHVLYEITHFVRAAQSIDAARAGVFPMNFAVEVFALHLRNLLDFFAPRSKRKTDASASDFCPDWEPPKLNLYLRDARWMADKHIAHLTTDRATDIDEKTWPVEPIVQSMLPIIGDFAERAEFVCSEFREAVFDRLSEAPERKDWRNLPPGPDLAPI